MGQKKTFEQPHVDSDTVAELSKKLLEANNELKRAELERKNMIENISHDLRAPLTAIRSAVDYLKQRNDEGGNAITGEELSSYLKLLDNRTNTLEVLIQDLFFLTCLDSGREKFVFEVILLAQFLEEHFFATEVDEKFKNYDLRLNVKEDMDVTVRADVSKLSRVLDNLLNNARKYSKEESIIELGAYVKNDTAFFYVKDNGNGISKEDVPYIFDRTFRASDSRTPEKEGSSGLGLSIAKSIIEKHDGNIYCESKEGEGSTFTVELPIVK